MSVRNLRTCLILLLAFLLSGCYSPKKGAQDGPPKYYRNVANIPDAKPHYLAKSRYGNPASYSVNGVTYRVRHSANDYQERGIASWYGSKFSGKLTSTRETYDPYKMTAASPVLPIPCFVRVTNLENDRSVIVKVNDRGPFAPNRIIDLSYAAATKLGYVKRGTALVEVTSIDMQPPVWAARQPHHIDLYLQAGSYHNHQNALTRIATLRRLTALPIKIDTNETPAHPLYRVLIGPLRGVGAADALLAELKQSGINDIFSVIHT